MTCTKAQLLALLELIETDVLNGTQDQELWMRWERFKLHLRDMTVEQLKRELNML